MHLLYIPGGEEGRQCCTSGGKRDGSAVHRVGRGGTWYTQVVGKRRDVVYPGGVREEGLHTARMGIGWHTGSVHGVSLHSLATPAHPAPPGPTGVQLLLCRTVAEHHLGSNL